MNINIAINPNKNTLETRYPKPKLKCPDNKVLYRVTFGYKSKLSGDHIFPVTFENFDESFQKKTIKLNPGDLVKYTPQNKKDPNYGRVAIIKKATNRYEKREAQARGLDVSPDKNKNSFYDIEFINPIVVQNQVIKIKNQIPRVNKDGSVQLTKTVDEVESYVCETSFVPYRDIQSYIQARDAYKANKTPQTTAVLRGTENRLWNQHFDLDDNNQPRYPLMRALQQPVKDALDRDIDNMVKVGFLLGKKEQRPEIKKSSGGFTLSFLMPKGAKPGDTITIPVVKRKGKKKAMVEIVIKIPITTGADRHTPKTNEYIRDVPIQQDLNGGVYDNLKPMKSGKDVDTKFKPTYIKASEYVGPDTYKDLDKLTKPGSTQQYVISNAKIIPQNGNKFIFKKLTTFNKDSSPLIFDLYVLVDLTLNLKLKGPDDAADDTFGGKLNRTVTAGILNGPQNCPEYMSRAREGASQLLAKIMPRRPIGMRIRRNIAARRQATRERAGDRMQRQFRRRRNVRSGRENVRSGGGKKKTRKKIGGNVYTFYTVNGKRYVVQFPIVPDDNGQIKLYDYKFFINNQGKGLKFYNKPYNKKKPEKGGAFVGMYQYNTFDEADEADDEGAGAGAAKTGGKRKKTRRRKKKCIRRATKRLNKCWKKKKRHTFKKCWKKGRKKYKSCKKKTKRKR